MKIKHVNVYDKDPSGEVNNEYKTSENSFRQPALHLCIGQRTAGKSYLCSKILAQCQKEHVFDVIYMVTPSFNSNKAYFGKYIDEDKNVYLPTKESIGQVIERVEQDRDEFEQYLVEKEAYDNYKKDLKDKKRVFSDDEVTSFDELGWLDGVAPTWKYKVVQPPRSLLILDDVLGCPAILQSSGLSKISITNRHIAPLKETFKERSACGLAVMVLAQTYRMQAGIGRLLRENVSELTLFKNRQEKQMDAIREELANVVPVELFDKAYNYATKEKFGSLTISFKPKCPTKTFRRNLNDFIMFPELPCDCKK
jgi:hypothetical protein